MSRFAALVEKFRGVAAERLARLREDVSTLRGDTQDAATRERLSRELHTLKGEAGMLGFKAMSRVAFGLEQFLPGRVDHPDAQTLSARGFALIDRFRGDEPSEDVGMEEAEAFVADTSALDP